MAAGSANAADNSDKSAANLTNPAGNLTNAADISADSADNPANAAGSGDSRRLRAFEWFLLGLIALGIACRFTNLNWDEGALLHPDERFLADIVTRIGWPSSPGAWFDSARSPFNPANLKDVHYVYGQWPLLLGKLAARVTGRDELYAFMGVGRALSALFDCFTVGLTFVVARRVLARQWALFAAASVALAALHVQQSHFFTVDNFAAFWMLAAFWGGTRWQTSGRARDALLAGACLGVAMACKISAVFIALPLAALLVMGARRWGARQLLVGAFVGAAAALLAFRVFNPMALVGLFDLRIEPRWASDLAAQAAITRGEVDVPFDVQWIGRAPWLFSARNLGFWGYGWGLLIAGALGAAWALGRSFKARGAATPFLLACALFCLVLFGVQGATFSKFTRYFLPMTPFLAILAADFWRRIGARWRWSRVGPPLVAGLSALWCVAVTSIYTRPHTRLQASRWIAGHIAPGTTVANETAWDETLPMGAAGRDISFDALMLDSYDADTPAKREKLLSVLDRAQWIFLSSGRSWQNIPRWPAKWPMTSRLYYALWSGELGFERARDFTSYPQLGPLQFPDDGAEEALSVYDHPRVILWRKGPNYSSEKVRAILDVPLPVPRDWQPRNAE